QKQLEEQYNGLIASADEKFSLENYEEAKADYEKALELKPDEQYPKDNIKDIEQKLKELSEQQAAQEMQKQLEEQYNGLIASADEKFSLENYEGAKADYEKALELKPDEQYPKDKIKEIEQKLKELSEQQVAQEKQKQLEEQYMALISEADGYFDQEDWDNAIRKYKEASSLKPEETYPKQQIIKANKNKIAAQKANMTDAEKEAEYKRLIKEADLKFGFKKLEEAKQLYQQALELKPDEKYPKAKISQINVRLGVNEEEDSKDTENDFVHQLAKEYPQGVTEREYTEGNRKILERIVVKGNVGHVYKEVTQPWGAKYYFKDDKPISYFIWQKETEEK
ncbi:MAG: hypothetical protein D6707_04265, partial [Bacteroidetes bacterium]